jgi:hypothetical protein
MRVPWVRNGVFTPSISFHGLLLSTVVPIRAADSGASVKQMTPRWLLESATPDESLADGSEHEPWGYRIWYPPLTQSSLQIGNSVLRSAQQRRCADHVQRSTSGPRGRRSQRQSQGSNRESGGQSSGSSSEELGRCLSYL